MLHELGAVRAQLDSIADTPVATAPVTLAVCQALDRAADSVHKALDDEDDRGLERAWLAITQAQDTLRAARSVIERARRGRQEASDARRIAARQREDARLQRRAIRQGWGPGGEG
jgi:hypothetical protein